jgi:hypothetical protein
LANRNLTLGFVKASLQSFRFCLAGAADPFPPRGADLAAILARFGEAAISN